MSNRYVVVRRWRSGSATLSLHLTTCRSVKRAEMATFIVADSPLGASVKASEMFRPEVTVGRSHWGAECACCADET